MTYLDSDQRIAAKNTVRAELYRRGNNPMVVLHRARAFRKPELSIAGYDCPGKLDSVSGSI